MVKYQPYPSYKDSGETWLGKVPEHWTPIRIGHLSPVKRGASPRPIEAERYFDEDGEYVWTRISDVTASDMYLTGCPERLSELGSSLSVKLQPGELFLSIAATVGKPCITAIKACIHDGFVYFPQLTIPNKFLYYVFIGGHAYAGLGKLGTQLNLNTDTVARIKVALGTEDEISSIVEFLDYETAKIDALIEKQQQLIALLGEKRQAVISHAVTKGLNPDAPMRDSGVEWLGEVPSHWDVKKFKHLLQMIVDNRGRTPPFGDDGVPMLEATQITGGTRYPLDNFVKFVPREIVDRFERDKVQEGDVLMTTVGATAGRAVLVDAEPKYFIAQNVIGMRPKQDVESDFLFYLVTSDFFYDSLFMLNKSNTIDNLKVSVFVNTQCPLPPRKEQRDIVERLNEQTESGLELEAKAIQVIELLQERRTALISAAVTGKIDVRGWKRPSAAPKKETEMEVA